MDATERSAKSGNFNILFFPGGESTSRATVSPFLSQEIKTAIQTYFLTRFV